MKLYHIVAFLISFSGFTQDYKFGKVSEQELEEKFNPKDSSASATYLYKDRNTFFQYNTHEGFQLITEIHERIKIYNKDGFDYATREVELFKNGSAGEKLTNLKANTYNFEGEKVVITKLKKGGVFDTELHEYKDQTTFTLPDIKEGTVIEYKYRITSPFYRSVDEFEFQHDIPIKKLKARFEAPEYFNFKMKSKGFLPISPKKSTDQGRITFTDKSRSSGAVATTSFETSNLNYTKNITTYDLTNIPSLKDEPYVDNINNYRSAIKYELSYEKFPNSTIRYFSTTWDDVVSKIYESSNFGAEIDKSAYYKKDIEAIINNVSNPMDKAFLIFNFVKSKMSWDGYVGKFPKNGVRKAYKENQGNVADINLMLTSMFRFAGLNSNPVLISTKGNGIPIYPTQEGFNYVISVIEMDQGYVLFDATSKLNPPNILPSRALNWNGRVIRKNGSSSLLNLYSSTPSKNTTLMSVNLNEDGSVSGSMRAVKTDYNALIYRYGYVGKDEDSFIEKVENKYDGMDIIDFEVKNSTDLLKPIMEICKFEKENQIEIIGNQMYVSPLLFFKTSENPFKLEKRDFPINYGYPNLDKFNITLKIPDGYKVESIPEPKILALPDNLGKFKFNIVANAQNIQIVVDTEINKAVISPTYYNMLKDFYRDKIEAENEKIVLTKL